MEKAKLFVFSAILLELLCLSCVSSVNNYIIKAGILGFKNQTNVEIYRDIAEYLAKIDGKDRQYCSLDISSVEYDSNSPSTVYDSLTEARNVFQDTSMSVAIGPYIDVFTSPEYVVVNQFHLLTSGAKVHEKIIPILPDRRSLSTAIVDVVLKLKWQKVAFLSQDDFSPVLKLGNFKRLVWPMRLPDVIRSHRDRELRRTLISLRESQLDKIILHSMDAQVVENVLEAAHKLHLLHPSIDWFITYLDFKAAKVNISNRASVYGLQLLKEHYLPDNFTQLQAAHGISRLHLSVMVDIIALLRHTLADHAESNEIYGDGGCAEEPTANAVMSASIFRGRLKNLKSNFEGALGRYSWPDKKKNIRAGYKISIVRLRNGFPDQIGKIEFLKGVPSVTVWGPLREDEEKDRIKGTTMHVITKLSDPFVMYDHDGTKKFKGFCVDLLDKISSKLGFTTVIDEISELHNGTGGVDEMIEELLTGNASIALGAIPVTATREQRISSSFTILSTGASMLLKKSPNTKNYFQFLGPFSLGLWLTIVGYFVVVALSVYLMSRFDQTQRTAEQKFDLKDSVWYSLNVLLQGATDYSPQTTSTRTIIAFFWFTVLIINAAYTANLAAYLTLRQIDHRIKNLHHLAKQTAVKYGVPRDSEIMNFFKKADQDPYERMWAFMKINEADSLVDPQNSSVIIDKVLSGQYAYIEDGIVNEYYAQQYCGVESIDLEFGYKHYGIAFPKGAPYKDDINTALLELKEQGELDFLRARWWAPRNNCTGEDDSMSIKQNTTAELELENMMGVFIILMVCVVLAIFTQIGKKIRELSQRNKKKEPPEPDVTIKLDLSKDTRYNTCFSEQQKPLTDTKSCNDDTQNRLTDTQFA